MDQTKVKDLADLADREGMFATDVVRIPFYKKKLKKLEIKKKEANEIAISADRYNVREFGKILERISRRGTKSKTPEIMKNGKIFGIRPKKAGRILFKEGWSSEEIQTLFDRLDISPSAYRLSNLASGKKVKLKFTDAQLDELSDALELF